MKKLLLALLIALSVTFTGCQLPVGDFVFSVDLAEGETIEDIERKIEALVKKDLGIDIHIAPVEK